MSVLLAGASLAAAFESARIDDGTALVSSLASPLAERGGDSAAVWCAVPTAADGAVVVFFHGNDGFVTASQSHPDGYVPSWAPRSAPPRAVGPAYALHALADAGPLRPIVLAPEVGVRDTANAAWATTSSGRFGDRSVDDALGSLVTDAVLQLRSLSYTVPDPTRVLVAGHSGGGRLIAAALPSKSFRGRAIDLLMLDATYGWGEPAEWLALLRDWQAHPETRNNRLVLAYLTGTGTQAQSQALLAAARKEGLPVSTAVWGAPTTEEMLRQAGLVGLAIPRGAVSHGAMPSQVLPLLVRTALLR